MNLCIFASGEGSNYQAIVNAIANKELAAKVVCVVSDKPHAYVLKRAHKDKIPTIACSPKHFTSKHEFEEAILEMLSQYSIDYIVCAGYMRIIGPTLLHAYPGRILNIHPSLLPKYKGKNALQQALEQKDTTLGASVHYIDETLDGGPIIEQRSFTIEADTPMEVIENRLHEIEHRLYIDVLKRLEEEKQ